MSVETDNERSIFFNTNDFGLSATYTPSGGTATTISGLLDNEAEDIATGGDIDLVYSIPVFTCKTSDVASAAFGDALVVSGTTYAVRKVEADAQGVTRLTLEA